MINEEIENSDEERESLESHHTGGKNSVAKSDHMIDQNESFKEESSLNGSLDNGEFNKRTFAEMKDDK